MGLKYTDIETIVCFRFKDYHDINKIKSLTKKYYDKIKNILGKDLNNENNVSVSLLIDHYIYNELLKSESKEDQDYIYKICERTLTHIINTRERLDKGYAYVKDEDDVIKYCKENFDGTGSFIHFMTEYALGFYNGKDEEIAKQERKELLKQERIYLDSLKKMYSCEKKLKFRF